MESVTGGTIDLERRYTIAELDELPEDGRKYELAGGWLIKNGDVPLLDVDAPSLRVLELYGSDYRQVAYGEGETPVTVERPFPVTVVPARLLEV